MIYEFKSSKLEGVYEIFPKAHEDSRGRLVKSFHKETFKEFGLEHEFGETLVTVNNGKGTLRGFHFQKPPYSQAKIFCCPQGRLFDVVLDMRKDSATFGQFDVFEIGQHNLLYVPSKMANAYCTLEDITIVVYNLTSKYMPEYDGGILWSSINANWPTKNPNISLKDSKLPPLGGFESPF